MKLLRNANAPFDRDIDMERKQNENAGREKNLNPQLLCLSGVVSEQKKRARETEAPKNMERHQEAALSEANSRRFEFDDSETTHNKKDDGEYHGCCVKHLVFLTGVGV